MAYRYIEHPYLWLPKGYHPGKLLRSLKIFRGHYVGLVNEKDKDEYKYKQNYKEKDKKKDMLNEHC